MSFSQSVRSSLVNFARVKGRAPRSEFWWFYLFLVLVGFTSASVDAVIGTPHAGDYGLITGILMLLSLVPTTTLVIRRLHDLDKSGWWAVTMFIPCLNLITVLVLGFSNGTPGMTQHGPDPRFTEREPAGWRWRAVAWSAPVSTLCVLAAAGVVIGMGGGSELETRVVRNTLPHGTSLPEDLKVGECIDVPDGKQVLAIPVVPCSDPHEAEVFAVTQLEDGPFPGKRGVMRQVARFCLPKFEEFAGEPYRRNRGLDMYLFYPMQETWEDDRGVTCLAMDPDGPTTGTLVGTNL